jgi:adenylate cyclase
MTHLVMESGGTIDKYIGDALMAFWNAPIPEGDKISHRVRSIETALKMFKKLRSNLMIQLKKEGKKGISNRYWY